MTWRLSCLISKSLNSRSFSILSPYWSKLLLWRRCAPFINHRMIQLAFSMKISENKMGTFTNMGDFGKCFVNWPKNNLCAEPLNIGTFIFILFGIFGILFGCSLFIFCTFIRCKKRQPMVYQTRSGTLTRRPLVWKTTN